MNVSSARAGLGAAALKGLENLDGRAPLVVAPAKLYAGKLLCSPQGPRCHLFVKKMRRAGQTVRFGELALPLTLPESRSAEHQGNAFARLTGSGDTDHSVMDRVIDPCDGIRVMESRRFNP